MRYFKVLLTISLASALGCTKSPSSKTPVPEYSKSEIVDGQFVFSGNEEVLNTYIKTNALSATVKRIVDGENHFQVEFKGKKSVGQVVADLTDQADFVEPVYRVYPVASFRKSEWPSDKFFFKQWAFNNMGQAAPYGLPGIRDADAGVLKAWEVTKGSKDVIVAVVDTGCDYTHPDLKDNIWINEKEAVANGGIPGIDDDGNGYVDDVYGYDFTSMNRTEFDGKMPGDSDPLDEGGHGTHCAGVIGAKPGNGMGVAGVNWNVKIMCVRFLGEGGGTSVDSYRAIRYARQNKAMILSNSWGGTGTESQLFLSEVKKLEKEGILFVAAAGNDGTNNDIKPHYPSNLTTLEYKGERFSNVLSVGASDNQDAPADFSNYGHASVDLFAPGVAILSTYPVKLTSEGRPPYVTMSGTSMATPYVSGIAALLMAANPSLRYNAKEVIRILKNTVDVKDTYVGKVASNGRINAYRALTESQNSSPADPIWQTKAEVLDQTGFKKELVDIRREIKVPGAKLIKVHFDFLQLEAPYDSVYLYDKDFRLISTIEQSDEADFWSAAVPGDTVHVRFVNSLVKQFTSATMKTSSERDCAQKGGISVGKEGDKVTCSVDAEDSRPGGDGSKIYNTFNSEGFRIDQVSYVMADSSAADRKESAE